VIQLVEHQEPVIQVRLQPNQDLITGEDGVDRADGRVLPFCLPALHDAQAGRVFDGRIRGGRAAASIAGKAGTVAGGGHPCGKEGPGRHGVRIFVDLEPGRIERRDSTPGSGIEPEGTVHDHGVLDVQGCQEPPG
jgi:hypothetical protein